MKDKYGNKEELWAKSLEGWLHSKGIKSGDTMNFDGNHLIKIANKKIDNRISL